ncbi:MAG: MaoC family dehydratase [Sphingomonadales bacterium]|nr:MaoC family dehydratase [Sphingomonadales bacterium]MBD3774778.1 MaoC family dehydratase [Paracoccaceae bacterium]
MLYFEDVVVGETQRFGAYEVTRDEVVDFASRYDPQAFHLDDEAAAKTYFGRLSASGWHTCAMTMRMMVDNMKNHEQAGLGSPGVDEIRWLTPVYPGDTLRVELTTADKRRSRSKPEMGSIFGLVEVFNQHDTKVLTMKTIGLIRCRDPQGA